MDLKNKYLFTNKHLNIPNHIRNKKEKSRGLKF